MHKIALGVALIFVSACSSASTARTLAHPISVTIPDDGTRIWAFADEDGLQTYAQTRQIQGTSAGEEFAKQAESTRSAVDLSGAQGGRVVAKDSLDIGTTSVDICDVKSSYNDTPYWTYCSDLNGV